MPALALPEKYYGMGSYDKWIRVCWVLRNTSSKLLILWIKFSSQAPNFICSFDELDELPRLGKLKHRWMKIREQAHSDYIIDEIQTYGKELDIVVEAKAKELAVLKYRDIYQYNKKVLL